MSTRKMNWERIRMEERGRSNGVEWLPGRRRFKEWITPSTADSGDIGESERGQFQSHLSEEEREALMKELLS